MTWCVFIEVARNASASISMGMPVGRDDDGIAEPSLDNTGARVETEPMRLSDSGDRVAEPS